MRVVVIACAVLLMLAVGAGALAQAGGAKRGGRFGGDEGLAAVKDLGLSNDQTKKIGAIVKKHRQDVGALLKSNAAQEEKRKKIQPLRSKAAADIAGVLTPAQRQKAKEKGLIERLLSPRPRDHGRLLRVLDQLNLSASQKSKVKAISDGSRAKAKAIGDNKSLTEDQKRAKLMELRKATLEKVKAVLTAQQKDKLEKLFKAHGGPGPGFGQRGAKRPAG